MISPSLKVVHQSVSLRFYHLYREVPQLRRSPASYIYCNCVPCKFVFLLYLRSEVLDLWVCVLATFTLLHLVVCGKSAFLLHLWSYS